MFQPAESTNHALNSKLYILDPMSVIVKLAILSNKPIGTKITIQRNAIEFNDYSFFQGLYRLMNGYNKADLHYLYNPIHFACAAYLTDDTRGLFESAQRGLKRLIDTYKQYSMVTVCLNYYDSIISSYMKTTCADKLGQHNDPMTSMYTPNLLNSLTDMWSAKNLKIVASMNEFLTSDDVSEPNGNVLALENIMIGIDQNARDIILSI